jgi:hypothetical protein
MCISVEIKCNGCESGCSKCTDCCTSCDNLCPNRAEVLTTVLAVSKLAIAVLGIAWWIVILAVHTPIDNKCRLLAEDPCRIDEAQCSWRSLIGACYARNDLTAVVALSSIGVCTDFFVAIFALFDLGCSCFCPSSVLARPSSLQGLGVVCTFLLGLVAQPISAIIALFFPGSLGIPLALAICTLVTSLILPFLLHASTVV